jgi:hypothetical protein
VRVTITYAFDPPPNLIRTTVTGESTLAEILSHLRRVSLEPWFPSPALVDARTASAAALPNRDIRAIIDELRALGPRLDGAPIAVLVRSEVSYGLVRMLEILLEGEVTIRPFRHQDEAINWLSDVERRNRGAR